MDTTEVIKFSTKAFEKIFVRDALFNKQIKDKIIITEHELFDGLKRNSSKLYVQYLFSDNEEEIVFLYKLLEDGEIQVINKCFKSDGEPDVAEGLAKVVDKKTNSKLEVSFFSILGFRPFWGDYWIIGPRKIFFGVRSDTAST